MTESSPFNEHDKGSNLLGIFTTCVLKKKNKIHKRKRSIVSEQHCIRSAFTHVKLPPQVSELRISCSLHKSLPIEPLVLRLCDQLHSEEGQPSHAF